MGTSGGTPLPTPLPVGPEIFIGLVAPVGTDHDQLTSTLQEILKSFNYKTRIIRVASLLHGYPRYKKLPSTPVDEYIETHQAAGDDFRDLTQRADALAVLAIGQIESERVKEHNDKEKIIDRCAYIIRSLKTPQEVRLLRDTYGDAFVLIGSSASHDARKKYLSGKIAASRHDFGHDKYIDVAERIIKKDQEETEKKYGQNLRNTFHLADIFVDAKDAQALRQSLTRALELLFAYPFHTPTRDEFGTFHAKAAALRSAELGRQVGAAITTPNGDIIAIGTNEVPRFGGGLYWPGDTPDRREYQVGEDANDRHKRALLEDLLNRLIQEGWLNEAKSQQNVASLAAQALDREKSPKLSSAQLTNLIEFMRAVHAEMAALVDAARRGVSVNGATMYVTTFPCHLCSPHIVASGIRRVVYIEPYAKSLASQLHPDSISVDSDTLSEQVRFESFVGIAPRRYMDLFTMVKRKNSDGKVIKFDPANALPRLKSSPRAYLQTERLVIGEMQGKIQESNVNLRLTKEELCLNPNV